MSLQLRQLALDAFRATAATAFQSGSRLRDRVTVMEDVEAATQRFPIFGVADANSRGSSQDVVPANIGNAKPTANLEPREVFDYIDRQDQAITNVDTMRRYGEISGKGVGRQLDNDIIEALKDYDATAYSRSGLGAALSVSAGTAGKLDAADIAKAVAMLMDELDNEDAELTLVAPALQFETWIADTKLANFDYLQQGAGRSNANATGSFEMIYGCKPILIGQKARRAGHGRLPDDRAYMFDRNCVGLAIGTVERMGVVEWVPQKRSWMVGAEANAGATRINNSGVVEIKIRP